ncbi:MAG TPA: hypothetical protein VEC99_01245 [Clostridia bacterium]|nr:hypothetical protein [Clostridia bacterium]
MAEVVKEMTREKTINRMLRCRKTLRYFKDGGWTSDPNEAKTFPDEIEAVRACVQYNLNDVELVLRAPGSLTDLFSTPIR